MRQREAVATFEAAKQRAVDSPTWILKLRIRRVRQRLRHKPAEVDQIRKIAFESVLKQRLKVLAVGTHRLA